jgi:hypothetical protein
MANDNSEDFFRDLREGKFDDANVNIIDAIIQEASAGSEPESGGITREMVQEALEFAKTTPKKSKGKRVAYSVACTLSLSGSDYQVQLLPPSSEYDKAYRLNKVESSKPVGYNVIQKDGVIICECSDFRFRQDGADSKGCKHIRGLTDMGMFLTSSISRKMGSGIFDG